MILGYRTDKSSRRRIGGFTLVELMLSIAFISLLLVAIATTAISISNTYTKGLTLREINQSGRLITQEIQRLIAEFNDDTDFEIVRFGDSSNPSSGRVCLGGNTIFWNTKKGLDDNDTNNVVGSGSAEVKMKLYVRKNSESPNYWCSGEGKTKRLDTMGDQDKELLSTSNLDGGANLIVYDFKIEKVVAKDDRRDALYKVSFVLGTDNKDIIPQDSRCRAPGEDVAAGEERGNDLYCAINKFEFIAKPGIKKE